MKEKTLYTLLFSLMLVLVGCSLANLFPLSFSTSSTPTHISTPGPHTETATTIPTLPTETATTIPTLPTETATAIPILPITKAAPTPILPTTTAMAIPPLSPTSSPSPVLSIESSPDVTQSQQIEPIFGIHPHDWSSEQEKSVFLDSGGNWSRFDGFKWDEIEPIRTDPPTYQWHIVNDDGLKNLAADDTIVIGIILLSPQWAQKYPGIACGPFAEDALDRFGLFMQELVSRYSQPPYNVKYWEIGNEPDIHNSSVLPDSGYGCWGETDDDYYGGRYYADMLKIVYPRIKEADPESRVLIGGLLLDCDPNDPPETQSGELRDCSSSKFLEGILENEGGNNFDGVSFHAYDYYFNALGHYGNGNWRSSWKSTGPVLISKAEFVHSLLEQYGYADKLLLNSEVALICGSTGLEDYCKTEEFEKTKANYVLQAYSVAIAQNLHANVWYSMVGWRGSGLVQRNNYSRYPAYTAFKIAAEKFEDVLYIGEVNSYPGIKGYEFENEDTRFWVLWALDDEKHEIILPKIPDAVYNSLGDVIRAEADLTLTLEPIYVEWKH